MSQREPEHAVASDVKATFLRRTSLSEHDYRLVRSVPLFAGLAEPALLALLRDAVVRQLPRGGVLFLQGDPASRFFVVVEGWVRLIRSTPEGNEVTIALFGRGESLAEAAMLQLGKYPVTGLIAENSRLLIVSAESFLGRLKADSDLCFALMASMARRLHQFVQQVEQLSASSTTQRLATFLLRCCTAESGACTIELPLDKALIAARLGMQPETFSRALAKLRPHGIAATGASVHIDSIEHLRGFCEGAAD
jgi:CRP-like cAMP-binding protein